MVKNPLLLSTYICSLLSLEIQKITNYIQRKQKTYNQIWILTKVGSKIILPVAAFG